MCYFHLKKSKYKRYGRLNALPPCTVSLLQNNKSNRLLWKTRDRFSAQLITSFSAVGRKIERAIESTTVVGREIELGGRLECTEGVRGVGWQL